MCPTAFCTEYYIDGQRFRAVVDTGSPFLMVDGSPTASNERWGRFLNDEQSVPLNDMSGEMYGGQDVDVEWRRGSLRLAGYANAKQQARLLVDRIRGARSGPWTTPKNGDALYEPINFGVVRTYQGRGGGGAIYLGLAKDRQPNRIRPTFLEQTDVRAATHTATRTHTFSSPFASLLVHAHLPLRPRLHSCLRRSNRWSSTLSGAPSLSHAALSSAAAPMPSP